MANPQHQALRQASQQVLRDALIVETILRNVESIHAVPLDVLPAGELRHLLLTRATDGVDLYCYQSGGTDGPWYLWLYGERLPLADYVAAGQQEVA